MNIAEASIKYKVVTIVFSVMLIVGGLISYNKLGRLEDPEFTIKDAQVFTAYPGATSAEVAEQVTDKLETAIQKLGQLKRVTSISEPGLSTIRVSIKDQYDKETLPQVWDELRRKVNDAQAELPPGTSTSIVYDDYGDVYGIFYAIYGDGFSYADLKEHAKLLRRELLLVQDVAKIELYGDQSEAVYVEVSSERLSQLGISPKSIRLTLSGQNIIAESGRVEAGEKYLRIRPTGELDSVDEIGDLLILQEDGSVSKLRIKDVAKVYRGYVEPPDVIMKYNGRRAIGLGISTAQGGNVVVMGEAVDNRLKELMEQTPVGIEIGIISHQAKSVEVAIGGFVISLLEAILIVIGVLMVAMGLRSSLLIGVILFMTVLSTFIFMDMWGVMLERISLGALIIALGMLVDNAIVIVEGILVKSEQGKSKTEAAKEIVSQTMWPLFGATVVAVLAFSAIGLSDDSTGEYCKSLFQVILISLLMSWVLAITVTPFLGVKYLKIKEPEGGDDDPYKGKFYVIYKRFLVSCIKNRYSTVSILVGMLLISFFGFGFVDKSFFPPSTRPQFMVHCWFPQGEYILDTEENMQKIERYIAELEGVTDVTGFVGKGAMRFLLTYTPEDKNSAYGMFLVDVDNYKRMNEELFSSIVEYSKKELPDALVFCRKFVLGPGDPYKIHVRLRGPDGNTLRKLADEVKEIARANPYTTGLIDDWRDKVSMVKPIVSEIQARNAGLVRKDVADVLQETYEGSSVGIYRERDEFLPIIFRGVEQERRDAHSIESLQIWCPVAQRYIPLSQVVIDVETVPEDTIIRRRNRLPCLTVKCDPIPGHQASSVFAELRPQFEKIKLPPGYQMQWGGEYEDSGDAQAALSASLPGTILLMVLIVIILFNSIGKPLVIFLNIPLALIGVTVGLLVTRQPFGFMALLGFLSLTGMLIKNAIVLIDEINNQLASGADPYDAIVMAGVSRLRPVSMAALTTVLGMIPLLMDAFFVSMAVTIMFGLTFATVLTLVVVPVLYVIFYRVKVPS